MIHAMLRRRMMQSQGTDHGYTIEPISALELVYTTDIAELWPVYYADAFTFDKATGLFTLTDAKELWVNAANYELTAHQVIGHYACYYEEPYLEIYYLPPDSKISYYNVPPYHLVYVEGNISCYRARE